MTQKKGETTHLITSKSIPVMMCQKTECTAPAWAGRLFHFMATHATAKHTFIMRQWDVMDPERKQHCRLQAHASVMHKQTGFYTSIWRHIPHHAEVQTEPRGPVNAWRKQIAEAAIATYTIFMGCYDANRPPKNIWELWLLTRRHYALKTAQPALDAGETFRSCLLKMHAPSKVKYMYLFTY